MIIKKILINLFFLISAVSAQGDGFSTVNDDQAEIVVTKEALDTSIEVREQTDSKGLLEPRELAKNSEESNEPNPKIIEEVEDNNQREEIGDNSEEVLGDEKLPKMTANLPVNANLASDFSSDYELVEHRRKWIIQYRYLGVLSQVGIERTLAGRISAGLYYGRYAGKVAGTDKLGFIPGLDHVALQFNAYLNREKVALYKGLVTRFGLHVNRQKENDLVQSIQVDGVDVIVPGQTKVGTLLGIGYQWNWKKLSVNAGMEYLTMGALKSFVPLAIGVGVTF